MLRNWQLLLAAFWLCVAVAILFRESIGLDSKRYSESHYMLFMALAGMLVVWNIVRWSTQRASLQSSVPPRKEPAPYEYNPEFDFQSMHRDDKCQP